MQFLTGRVTARSITLVAFETGLIVSAIATAAYVRLGSRASEVYFDSDGLLKIVMVAAILQTCLYFADLYDLRVLADRRELFIRLVHALASTSFLLAVLYFWFPSLIIGRGVIMIATLLVIALVLGWRLALLNEERRCRPQSQFAGCTAKRAFGDSPKRSPKSPACSRRM